MDQEQSLPDGYSSQWHRKSWALEGPEKEELPPSDLQARGLITEVLQDFGILVTSDLSRFEQGTWTYQGEPPVLCGECFEPLHVYRRAFRAYGKNLQMWGIVCPHCSYVVGIEDLDRQRQRELRSWDASSSPEPLKPEPDPEIPASSSSLSPAELLTVSFIEPVNGKDPLDGVEFRADRHRVAAASVSQNADSTEFVNADGKMIATWPTPLIVSISWPQPQAPLAKPEPGEPFDWIRRDFPNAYMKWTIAEDEQLKRECNSGISIEEICASHGRQPSAVRSRINHLGLTTA